MTGGTRLREFGTLARDAAEAGFAGLVITESGRTAYLSAAVAAIEDVDLDLATGVAVAFPRSPMVTAATAWELAQASGGRFRLGLGTQVRAHIERRYSAPFDHPGPRLREYVEAVKACFAGFRGERLDYHGEFYEHTLLPAMWSPGPIDVPDPPVDIAAVNPWMLRTAGAVADGVHVHPLNSTTYYEATLLPNLSAGRGAAGLDDYTVFVPIFTAAGDTTEERDRWRETTRTMIGFYGSTPNYAFVFDQIGRPGTTEALRATQKAGDPAGMNAVIDDEILDHFLVEGPWDEMPDRIVERMAALRGTDVQPVLYHAGMTYRRDPETFARFGALAASLGDC
ncbi:MAG: TIGR03617 family F420-dependent LLM class oxidoreductase [Acidimicrobiia bacterium]